VSKPKTDVFDLDGTLVDTMKYKKHHKHRHEGFAKEAETAPEIKKNVKKLKKEQKKHHDVVILTARSAHYEKETKDWLKKHDIKTNKLVMRPQGDSETPDSNIKEKLLKKDISRQFDVREAFDDKSKNVNMFKKQGIKAKKV
jgi:FMN phosphatase YigB (HAD superfamily)